MLKNKKWTEEYFLKERKKVLATWPIGNDPKLNLDDAINYVKSLPPHKNFGQKLIEAEKEGITLVQPRAGVPVLDKHIELMQFLEKSGADFAPSTIDSYTRLNRYDEAEKGIEESIKTGRALLNGFPAVNHGVDGCRLVQESIDIPIQARHGTPDGRLLAEITYAAGWTSYEGGGISYNVPYAKNATIEQTIIDWQYVDRLAGYYEERGVTINREPFGPLTGTICPPCISNTVAIIETLLAAEQGVKNVTVGYGMGGNITQDVAAIRALKEQTLEYLDKYGYQDMHITTVFHQWMGGFPADESQALALISLSSTVAALSKATKMITKSPHESIGIPTMEANGEGIKASKYIVNLLKDQQFPESEALLSEIAQIKKEVKSLLDAVFKLGNGDLAIGTVKAFEQGVIDVPFAPSKFNRGAILPARDNEGYIRILEFGNLGFSEDIKKFHRDKIRKRAEFENREVSFQLTVDDVYAVSQGVLVGRPQRKESKK